MTNNKKIGNKTSKDLKEPSPRIHTINISEYHYKDQESRRVAA